MSDIVGTLPTKQLGPTISVVKRCHGCALHVADYYCVEDGNDVDSGYRHYCTAHGHKKFIGFDGVTPSDCPHLPSPLPVICDHCGNPAKK